MTILRLLLIPFVLIAMLHRYVEGRLGNHCWRVYPVYLFLFGNIVSGPFWPEYELWNFAITIAFCVILHYTLKRGWQSQPTP